MVATPEGAALETVIGIYEKKLQEGKKRAVRIENDLANQHEKNHGIEGILEHLHDDARKFAEKGPYFEAKSIPQAVKMYLKDNPPGTTKQIAGGLLEGGFQTDSESFERATYTALNRLCKKGKITRIDNLWHPEAGSNLERDGEEGGEG